MNGNASRPRVIAFYAYKGGTGQTTALIHAAWALAHGGRRIVMLDLDLEAPSLWQLIFPEREPEDGFVEYLSRAAQSPELSALDFLHQVELDDDARGELRLFGAGRMDAEYLRGLSSLDWQSLLAPVRSTGEHGPLGFGAQSLFERFCESLAPVADAVFIDTPKGLNNTANVCLRRLADMVILMFTPSRVQLEGVGRVVSLLAEEQAARGKPDVFGVVSTLHIHRLTREDLKHVEQAFEYLERVRRDALGRPPFDGPESSTPRNSRVSMCPTKPPSRTLTAFLVDAHRTRRHSGCMRA